MSDAGTTRLVFLVALALAIGIFIAIAVENRQPSAPDAGAPVPLPASCWPGEPMERCARDLAEQRARGQR